MEGRRPPGDPGPGHGSWPDDVFAAHAAKHAFDEVHEVHVRDGGDMEIPGYAFAPVFSIWTTIEECLNPPIIWDAARGGHYTTKPFSAPEAFVFPEGIGPVECVNVEHEEVLLVPRGIPGIKKVSFKYALGADFINVLRVLHAVGLDSTKPVTVKGMEIAPRDLLAAVVPDPAKVGERMKGRAIVGTWAMGTRDGGRREVYLYQKTVGEDRGPSTASRRSPTRPASTRPRPGAAGPRRVGRRRRLRAGAAGSRSVHGGARPVGHPLGGRGARAGGQRPHLNPGGVRSGSGRATIRPMTSVRVPGFTPATGGLRFANAFSSAPFWRLRLGALVRVEIGDVARGLCGGMTFVAADHHRAGLPPPADDAAPPEGSALRARILDRQVDSFDRGRLPLRFYSLMLPLRPARETPWSRALAGWASTSTADAGHGRARWPRIRRGLDAGRLVPLGLVRVVSANPSC